MRRGALLLTLVAFVFSSGGEWSVLQCVAWANMVREYAQAEPLQEALQMTFSGQHPCAMCKAIASKKQHDNSKTFAVVKLDKPLGSPGSFLPAPEVRSASITFVFKESYFQSRDEAPPTPPPQTA